MRILACVCLGAVLGLAFGAPALLFFAGYLVALLVVMRKMRKLALA